MENIPIHIQLRNERKKLGLTQVEFAERAGVGLRFLRELERGKPTVRLDKLNKVLAFHGLRLELAKSTGIHNGGSRSKL